MGTVAQLSQRVDTLSREVSREGPPEQHGAVHRALAVVVQRPKDLTRAQLKEVRMLLDGVRQVTGTAAIELVDRRQRFHRYGWRVAPPG